MKEKRRILIVDDNEAIHSDFKKILIDVSTNDELEEIEGTLFGSKKSIDTLSYQYIIDDAYQGEEAIKKVDKAADEGFPYSVIFMDVRMPPGIDGVETTEKIWEKHPNIEMVIASAYSDYSWDKILEKFGQTDKLLFVKKPFNIIVIKQLTLSLITKWVIAEKNREYMEHLEKQVKERTLELQELLKHMTLLKEKAEESDNLKSAFLANMSHEIRSPMNTILGFTDLLAKNNLSEEKRIKFLGYINSSGKSLLNLINDIICIAKIEAGVIDIHQESFPLNLMLSELSELFRMELNGNGIPKIDLVFDNIHSDHDLIIHTDRERLKQIITNLFSNAMKFTRTGSIHIGYSLENNGSIMFYVKDTGIGIKKEDIEMIFGRFKQSKDDRVKISTGTGLGLAITKNLVELLGGKIWASSEINQGSAFYFTLPYEEGNIANVISKERPTSHKSLIISKKQTVLIAEDQTNNYYLIEELLSNDNITLLWAKDGLESVSMFSQNPEIDLVLMDIKMPGLDGIALMKLIKSELPDVLFIFIDRYNGRWKYQGLYRSH
jgi:signal transduction histidine kinase/DNA-binding NarL/FixJ family response regulator